MKKHQSTIVNRQSTNIDVDHVAKLANLSLSPAEKKIFEDQLGKVLDYINHLNKVNTVNIEPIGQITELVNVTREDKAAPSLSQGEALANAPRTHNGFFEVDAIFEENSPNKS